MCNYLSDEGEVAIFDATNTTRERRQTIYEYCTQTFCFRVFFVESICDSLEIIDANIRVCYFKRTKKRSNQINLISSGSEIKKS
jgi:predicted kinase